LGFKAVHYSEIPLEQVEESGAEGVHVRWLISDKDGAENFAMRHFTIAPGGHTPLHSHDWEHEVFVLKGEGVAICGNSEKKIKPEYVVYVPPNVRHCFKNTGNEDLCILCLIPYKK